MREALETIWRAGVEACLPGRVLAGRLPPPPPGRTILLALGKGAVAMAAAVERDWPGPLSGLAVGRDDDDGAALRRIGFTAAAHPVPDARSVAAANSLLALAEAAGPDDLVLLLLSGGASALACLPGEGLSLAAKQDLTEALLRSGAAIGEINLVRRHLSRFKGGRLALEAAPARLVTLAISDVVGDRPEDIGSGPTAADPTTIGEARAILDRYRIAPPAAGWSESAKQVGGDFRLVASGADALAAAAAQAKLLGYAPETLVSEGEARLVGKAHAARIAAAPPGTALISGGELTVTVTGSGFGGPNQEYALAAALALAGREDVCGLAADSDGIDGRGGAAGAFFDGGTVSRAPRRAEAALADNDSNRFFAGLGDLFLTGPTGTNVNDLRILLKRHG